MVDGLQKITGKSVMAVDLDGTYLRGNSLKMYVTAGCCELLRRGETARLTQVLLWLATRKLRLVSHIGMKNAMFRIIGWDGRIEERFKALALPDINPDVSNLMEEFESQGGRCIIVSAAFGFYIPSICQYPCLATSPGKTECRGKEKARRLTGWVMQNGATLHSVVTDHPDDIPLLRLPAQRRYLVNPSKSTIRAIEKAGITGLTII